MCVRNASSINWFDRSNESERRVYGDVKFQSHQEQEPGCTSIENASLNQSDAHAMHYSFEAHIQIHRHAESMSFTFANAMRPSTGTCNDNDAEFPCM